MKQMVGKFLVLGAVAGSSTILVPGLSAQHLSLASLPEHGASEALDTEPSLLERPAQLVIRQMALPAALTELRNRAGVPLVFSETLLSGRRAVSCACGAVTVREALDSLLEGTDLRYTELRTQVVIEPRPRTTPSDQSRQPTRSIQRSRPLFDLLTRMAPGTLLAANSTERLQETATIRGVVRDAEGSPVPAASVTIDPFSLTVATDRNGAYTIVVPARHVQGQTVTIRAQSVGFRAAERTLTLTPGTHAVDFALEVSIFSLDEIVVTGVADATSARRVPFTVSRVSAENLAVPAENAMSSLQGKVAGASIVSSPDPGGGISLLLRSPTSINKTTFPLVVVDGVILSNFTRSTADLAALDIESIEVVKGAAAASLYGSRAANGVIQIRTRRGTGLAEGRTQFTVRSEVGRSSLARTIDRAKYHHYLVNDQGEYIDAFDSVVDRASRVERPVQDRYQDVAYGESLHDPLAQFFNPGAFNNHSITVARRSSDTNFYLSFGNQRTGGVVLESGGYTRNDLRVNLDHTLRDDLQLSVSGFHMKSDRAIISSAVFSSLVQQAPDIDLRVPDPDGTPYLFRPDPSAEAASNPLYRLYHTQNEESRVRTLGSVELKFTPVSWLTIDSNLSYDRSDRLTRFFYPMDAQTDVTAYATGAVRRTDAVNTALNGWLSARAHKSWGDLSARATVRGLIETERYDQFNADGTGLSVSGTPTLDAATTIVSGLTEEDVRAAGYFMTTGLDYKGRYIFDGLVRRDGSSLFGPDERWHTYYRTSFAYRVAEEEWWPFAAIDEFKLRYSRGTAGGRPSFQDQYETLDFGEAGGFRKTTLGNRALKPELATEQEFGVDMIVGPVSLQLAYADVNTVDQLIRVPLSGITGYTAQWRNAGTVKGNTLEATLEAQLLNRGQWRWSAGLVFDRSRNRITQYDSNCFRTGPDNIGYHCKGETLGTMYGNYFLTSLDELPENLPASEFQVNDDGLVVWVGEGTSYRDRHWGESVTLGERAFDWGMPVLQVDEEGSPVQVRIGDSNPSFHLGFSSQVGWRNFSLYGLIDLHTGGDIYNRTKQRMYQYYRSADTDQAGKAPENKKIVEYYSLLYNGNNLVSWFVEDASYLKLRELSLRYSAPGRSLGPLGSLGIERMTVSVIGRNLFTRTNYSGFDPEVGSPRNRFDDFAYPQYQTITAAIQLAF